MISKEECLNAIQVLEQSRQALLEKNSIKLRELSNRTTHTSCTYQDEGSILIAVLVYTLSKLIEREDFKKIKDWDKMATKINLHLGKAVDSLENEDYESYKKELRNSKSALENASVKLKPYIEELLRKAEINKAAKFYEHGLSLEKTADILGVTQWELSEYTGQKEMKDIKLNRTINTKTRIKMAMDFLK
jgi:hypothetical protein